MFFNSIFNVIVSFVFSAYYISGNINKILFYTATHSNFDEMHKVFIGGYTDSAHSTILDGFNGIIGGKTRNEVTTFSVILMKSTYVKNLSVFVINVFAYFLHRRLLE